MIDNALIFLKDEVNKYMMLESGAATLDERVVLSNIVNVDSDNSGNLPIDKVVLSLICIEEERQLKAQDHYARTTNGSLYTANPEMRFNLYVLFAAHFQNSHYDEALKFLSLILRFFQGRNVFDIKEYPELKEDVKRLIVDLHTQPMEQQSQLWQALGGKFLPSVMYKIRMLTVNEGMAKIETGRITEIQQ
jgi:hypothetical protein